MFWLSRQRYQNEVPLPGPRCPLHICIDVLRQTQSSHVPSQTPKYHKIPHSKSQPENAGICFLEILVLYLVCICLSGSFWCLTIPESWAAQNDEYQKALRRKPPASNRKAKAKKTNEMHMKFFQVLSFKIRKYFKEKNTL